MVAFCIFNPIQSIIPLPWCSFWTSSYIVFLPPLSPLILLARFVCFIFHYPPQQLSMSSHTAIHISSSLSLHALICFLTETASFPIIVHAPIYQPSTIFFFFSFSYFLVLLHISMLFAFVVLFSFFLSLSLAPFDLPLSL